jgi:hypothetical protein
MSRRPGPRTPFWGWSRLGPGASTSRATTARATSLRRPGSGTIGEKALSDQFVGLRARDAEELGDLGDGVGESLHDDL